MTKHWAIKQLFNKYRRNTSGQFAVWFALLAVPIITMIAYVGDMTYAGKIEAELKGSLDAAALASVINQKLTEPERKEFAKSHFNENFEYSDMFDLDVVNASAKKVELAADGSFPSYLGAIAGRNKVSLSASSASILTTEDIICVLALDPNSDGAFTAEKGAKLFGKECSVQVNSISNKASIVSGDSSVSAKSFCVSGGAVGYYTPLVNTECARVEDPYKNLQAPAVDVASACAAEASISVLGVEISPKWIYVLDKAIMRPGVYCKTVSIEGKDIVMLPGNYIFLEDLEFFNGSEVTRADGVTLFLNGPESVLYMQGGATINMKAPSSGPYAGIAIFQNQHVSSIGSKGYSAISQVKAGSGLNITGTIYLPSQRIEIGRDSNTSISNEYLPVAPATSFIASQIHLSNSVTSVAVDHKAAGLPPLLPRSDEGARLVE